jgi:two-component system, OmpR family, sensor histidine kinase VicK
VSEVDPPDNTNGERTEIIYGTENVIKFSAHGLSTVEKRVDVCGDYSMPSVILAAEPVKEGYYELNRRGIKIRWITDVTKENISSCKEIMKIAELRHLDGVKGGFVVSDEKVYVATAILQMENPVIQLIYSNVKAIVEQQQYIFNTLWDKAIPSKQRIREVEEEVEREFIETIKDPYEILDIGYKLINAAKDEILIIFHTANAFLRQNKAGGIDLLIANTSKYKTRVKILVPMEDKIRDTIERLDKINGVQIRNIEPTMQTRMTILVVDRMYSLVVELLDDSKENSEEAVGLATYSNSRSTVLSYASIFETLWKQSELREELYIRSMAQKEFINIAAHELRNPIQPILGLSEVLLQADTIFDSSNKNNLPIQKEMVEIIVRNARRLQRLTEDILDITRIEGKTLKLNKHRFILVRTIREMIKDYASETKNRSIAISFHSSKELDSVGVLADEERIKQVISNLLDNAIKFTEGTIFVTVETTPENNQVLVNVKDTGRGIDSDILPKLFTKFVTKSDRGTGLGLYICKGIVEAHGGKIWAKNNSVDEDRVVTSDVTNITGGATFSFSLPLDNH